MERARLGREGPHVSRLCLGTATFAGQADETASRAILDRAAEAGVTFLDTADVYPMAGGAPGAGEALLGRWLEGRRDDFVLATKGGLPIGGSSGNGRRHLTRALEGSLRRLRTDHVDVYLLHAPDPGTPLDDALETLDGFVRAGKVRHIGCSNFPLEQLGARLGRFAELQPRLNLLRRDDELLAAAGAAGAGVVPYNPLAGGLLTGKHAAVPAAGSRFALDGPVGRLYRERYWSEDAFAVVANLRRVAAEIGTAPATLAVAWLLAQPAVTSVILGATRAEQLDATLAAASLQLDDATLAALTHQTTGSFA